MKGLWVVTGGGLLLIAAACNDGFSAHPADAGSGGKAHPGAAGGRSDGGPTANGGSGNSSSGGGSSTGGATPAPTGGASGAGGTAGGDTDAGSSGGSGGSTDGGSGGFTVDPDSLRAHTSNALRYIGTAVDADALRTDATYREVLGREFDSVTPEHVMTWPSIHPQPTTWSFEAADALVDFAEAHGQRVRGHALVWPQETPAWLDESMPTAAFRDAFRNHISTLVGRYRGRVAVWDVVNEAMSSAGGLRDSLFRRKLGDGYVEEAFRAARDADPDATLVYNDIAIDTTNPKADDVFTFLEQLKVAGAPVDAVGLEFHVSAYSLAGFEMTEENIRAIMRRFASLGLEVHITELDVRLAELSVPATKKLEYQAQVYQRIAQICRSEPSCTEMTLWGFTDAHSWVDGYYGPDDPLPFDESYKPKPAFLGLRDGMDGKAGPGFDLPVDTACRTLNADACTALDGLGWGTWYTAIHDGALESVASPVFRGGRAARATSTAGVGRQAMIGKHFAPGVRSGTVHARAYVYLPSTVDIAAISVLALGERVFPYQGLGVSFGPGGSVVANLTEPGINIDSGTYTMPRDRWNCIQMTIDVGTTGSFEISVDGTPVVSKTGVDTLPASGYGAMNAGITYTAGAQGAVEVFFDEVAAGTAPLPCD